MTAVERSSKRLESLLTEEAKQNPFIVPGNDLFAAAFASSSESSFEERRKVQPHTTSHRQKASLVSVNSLRSDLTTVKIPTGYIYMYVFIIFNCDLQLKTVFLQPLPSRMYFPY